MAKPEPGRARPNKGFPEQPEPEVPGPRRPRRTKRTVQSSGNDLLNYAGGAQFLGIAEKTLQGWVERGTQDVPYIRLGRLIRFRPASLSRWLESRERNQ